MNPGVIVLEMLFERPYPDLLVDQHRDAIADREQAVEVVSH
jgi:hypothetical protein